MKYFSEHILSFLLFFSSFVHSYGVPIKGLVPVKDDGLLEVFIIPHSHCDPGWWYTFDHYHEKWVVGILDSVHNSLKNHPYRTFIWAEVSYFQKWYKDKSESVHDDIREFIKQGRLEFVTGGWVMHDEAVSHYRDDLLQLEVGQAWLWNEFQIKPSTAWLIDPFGHSPTTPILYDGYKGAVINRIYYQTRDERRSKKELEFLWEPKFSRPDREKAGGVSIKGSGYDSASLLVHTLAKGYYDIPNTCGPDYNVCESFDFENGAGIKITSENLASRAKELANQYRKKSEWYKTNSLLMPIGDDFKYKSIAFTEDFLGMYDQLFDYINDRPDEFKMKIKYANLSSYFDSINGKIKGLGKDWSTFPGSFLEYSDRDEQYWSGFYTSRAVLKRWIREAQVSLRLGEFISSWEKVHKLSETSSLPDLVTRCQEDVSLLQHHDAVTGTARRAVVLDYQKRLSTCVHDMNKIGSSWIENHFSGATNVLLESASSRFLHSFGSIKTILLDRKSFMNEQVKLSLDSPLYLIVLNTLSQDRSELVYLKVKFTKGLVIRLNGVSVVTQMYEKDDGWITAFRAKVPALGYSIYELKDDTSDSASMTIANKNLEDEVSLSNSKVKITIKNGNLREVCTTKCTKVLQKFVLYDSVGSGAYIFSPQSNEPKIIDLVPKEMFYIKGPLYEELQVIYSEGNGIASQVFRLEINENEPQRPYFDHAINIDIGSVYHNHDLAVRYRLPGKGKGVEFWTDANGWFPLQNVINSERTFSSQFRPFVSKLSVNMPGQSSMFSWLTRSSMAAMMKVKESDAFLELVLDRQASSDDGRGLVATASETGSELSTLRSGSLFPWLKIPNGASVHSIRPCIVNPEETCIHLEHDGSSPSSITVKVPQFTFARSSDTECSIHNWKVVDKNDNLADKCPNSIALNPFELKTIRFTAKTGFTFEKQSSSSSSPQEPVEPMNTGSDKLESEANLESGQDIVDELVKTEREWDNQKKANSKKESMKRFINFLYWAPIIPVTMFIIYKVGTHFLRDYITGISSYGQGFRRLKQY